MKKVLLLSIVGIFLISLASAIVYQTNYVKYGTINGNGDLVTTSTSVNGASAIGFVCSNPACSSISGTLWGGNSLSSSGNQLALTYPTTLQSPYGYGVYVYKEGYIPYEIASNWHGTGTVSPMNAYLTKKQTCNSVLSSISVSSNQQTLSVSAAANAPIQHAGLLGYVPSELSSHYSTKIDITLEVRNSGGTLVYRDTNQVTTSYSGNAGTNFSRTLSPGSYTVKVYTTLENEPKCLAYTQDSEQQSINIPYPDNDGDGYASNVDCNDNNVAINPGATETCDGVDNDCDGQVDEGMQNTYYKDADGDGYGNSGSTTQACSVPSGYVINNDDCDDGNAAINPGATEILDGVDNDCDGQIDEGLCGDGNVDAGEECDDGNTNNGDGCSSTCQIETPPVTCGDGNVDAGEECDDGTNNGQVCTPLYNSSCNYCDVFCVLQNILGSYCGDNILNILFEECDDGNNINGDGCSSVCETEQQHKKTKGGGSSGFKTLEFGTPVSKPATKIIYEIEEPIELYKEKPTEVSVALVWLLGIGALILLVIVLAIGLRR